MNQYLHLQHFIFLLKICSYVLGAPYMGGIAVPGQSVSPLDVFNLFHNSCRPKQKSDQLDLVGESINLIANSRGANLASQMQRNLYNSVGAVDLTKLMGKWYRVIDSPGVHANKCLVSYQKMKYNSTYLANWDVKDYYREGNNLHIDQGYGTMIGPGPGRTLLHPGDENDKCPYTLVKVGPEDSQGQYSYAIWTQLLKYPVIGYARDPIEFERIHRRTVEHFLTSNNYNNAIVAAAGNRIAFMDMTDCMDTIYSGLD